LEDIIEQMGLSGQTVQESHLALQIRSRTELRTGSDGTVSERTSAKLQFHYDLTTADGQHIELNVKAKVQQASVHDAAGNSISKTQVKLQFSLLQEGVADSLSPLQSDQVPSDTQSGAADGLQAFLNSVGDALQNFVEGDNVTADDLVTKTVDSFNTLLDALSNLLFPTAGTDPPAALPPSGEAPGQIPAILPPPASDSEPTPAVPVAISLPPAPLPTLPAAGSDVSAPTAPETPPTASGANSVTNDPTNSADPVPANPAAADQNSPAADPAPAAGNIAPPADSNVAASPAQLGAQVLQTVKLRFVQSLTQIIRSLTSEQPGNSSVTSQRLDYHSALSLKIHATSLVDVNA
jgi:hypothetical protein